MTEKVRLKIREDVQTTHIEVTTSSSDVADEGQFIFTQADGDNRTKKQILLRSEQSQKKATEWVANQEPSSMKPSTKEFTKFDGSTTSYSWNEVKANARIGVEQDTDLVLKNLKLKIPGQPHDGVLLTTDGRFSHYTANWDRIIFRDGLLFRKYYGETGIFKYYQNLIPKQLVSEVLQSLYGEFGNYPGITKTKMAEGEKFYYPNMAQLIKEWVISCEQGNKELRINRRLDRPPLRSPNEYITALENKYNMTWCRNYLRPVAMKRLSQVRMFFPLSICLTNI